MTTKIHNVQQRTPEWTEIRLGKLTASRLKDILDMRTLKLKSKDVVLGAAAKIISEIETGFSCDSDYQSDAMEWGLEGEQDYKDQFLYKEGYEDIGFATNSKFPLIGCSPDAVHTSVNIAAEIKCLSSANHLKIIFKDEIPKEYMPQIFMYFIVFDGLNELLFISYDSRNSKRPVYRKIIRRDEILKEIEMVEVVISQFHEIVQKHS